MIPPATNPRWRQLVEGKVDHQFGAVSASMMLGRLRRQVKTTPSEENVRASVAELRQFCEKYEHLLTEDLKAIFR